MSRRMRVFLSAFACEPGRGSEPEVGWQWALQIARFHDVTVLTQSKNRPAIEAALKSTHGSQLEPRFVYFDLPRWMQHLRKYPIGLRIYYVFWQNLARPVVQRLHSEQPFDLLHHITFAAFRYPTVIWGHGVPCIWGPIGGIESIPARLLPWTHPFSLVHEVLRNLSNVLQAAPYRDLPRRAAASNKILVSTREMQDSLSDLEIQSQLMPTVGLKTGELPFQPRRSSDGPLRILYVGNIITLKGIDLALEALSASGTDATFTLVGTGNYLSASRRVAGRLGLAKRVVFRGRLTRAEVLSMYREFDVLLFPSLHDTGGYAVIEAMFNELPVICLDCGGPAVAVQPGCGIKVPVNSRKDVIAGLAAAIRHYDRDRQVLCSDGKAARQSILNNYDWDKKGSQMNEVYQQTTAEASGNGKSRPLPTHSTYPFHKLVSIKGIMFALLSLLLVAGWGFFSLSELKHQAQQIVEDTLPGLTFAGEANAYIADAARTLLFISSDDAAERMKLRNEIKQLSNRTTLYLNEYQQSIFTPEDRRNYESVKQLRSNYTEIRDMTLDLASCGKRQEALTMYRTRLMPAHTKLKTAADRLFAFNMSEGQLRGVRIMNICTVTQIVLAVTSVGIFLLGFFIGFLK